MEWDAFEATSLCEVEATKSNKHISQKIPESSKIHYYKGIIPVELIYFMMLSNAFRKRTCKHESKRKSYKSSDDIVIIE